MIKNNPKNKKRPVKKVVSSYDTKLIWIVVAAVVVITAGILAAVAINAFNNSFIGRVDGMRVQKYEYNYFLKSVMSEMESEAEEADEDFDEDTFWTDEKKAEAKEKAIDEVVKWSAEYKIAIANGGKLTKEEKTNISNNLNSYISYYYQLYTQYYSSTYTLDQICQMVTGVTYDELDEYTEYLCKQEAINKYLEKQEETYNVSDLYFKDEDGNKKSSAEDAIKDQYNSKIDEYRRIEMTVLAISKGTAPTAPTVVEEPTKPETEDETSTEYVEYTTKLASYNEYLEKKATYETELEEFNKTVAELKTKVETMRTQLNEKGTYTGKGYAEVATEEKDSEGNAVKAIKDYTDATIETIAETESTLYSSTKGANTFTGEVTDDSSFLAKLAQSMNWVDDTYKEVKSNLADKEEGSEDTTDYTFESIQDNGKFKETKLKLFEDDDNFYVVKVTGILDLNTSTEEPAEKSEDDEDAEEEELSVRQTVINDLKAVKSVDDIEKLVADAGDKYALKGRKDKVVDAVVEELFA